MLYTYYGNNAEYHIWYSAIFAFVIFMLFLGDFAVLDSFYALFDEALGVTWYGMPPTQFLDVWKTLPNASAWPDSGISLGFGWGTNLQLKGSPQNLWSGGYIVAIFVASLTALWAFYLEWKTDAAKLNKSSDYDILLSPKGDGLENIMRFFAAAQDEVLQNKSMGIANNDALNEWIHGEGADAFLRNITQHEKREHVYAAIVNQPVQIPGRAAAGVGPKRHFV
jgi:hypothetical protein